MKPPGTPRRPHLASLLALALGMLLSLFAFAAIWESRRDAVFAQFERQALDHADVIKNAFERRLVVVESVAAFFGGDAQITREQFAVLTQPLLQRFPALSALFWVPGVSGDRLPSFERDARKSEPGYGVYGHGNPTAPNGRHYPVLFIEPRAVNIRALGFDLPSDPCYRQLLEQIGSRAEARGCRLDAPPLTAGTRSLVILHPVYLKDMSAGGAEPFGFAGAVFRIGSVVEHALQALRPAGIDLVLFETSGPLEDRFIYFHPSRSRPDFRQMRAAQALEQWTQTELDFEVPFAIAGSEWIMRLSPANGFYRTGPGWEGWGTLAAGSLFSSLLALYLFSVRNRSAALAAANGALSQEMGERKLLEQALFEEKERAEVTLNSIGDAVISIGRSGAIGFLNPAAEALTGWPLVEARGRPLREVFRAIDEGTRRPLPDPVDRCLQEGRSIDMGQSSSLLSRSGQQYAIQALAAPIRGRRQEILGVVLTFRDVTPARRSARWLAHRAAHDPLTGLLNRREFEDRLRKAIVSSRRYHTIHTLCYIDLDHFKAVNDTAGHLAGDELLKRITAILSTHVRERDTLARLGGDEFALLLDNCPVEKTVAIAQAAIAAVRDLRFVWAERSFELGASIGVVAVTAESESVRELLREADAACYRAKALGRNRVHVYRREPGR